MDFPLAIRPEIPGRFAIGEITLLRERLVHHAHGGAAGGLETDQRAVDRHARNEGACAVNRVYDPDVIAVETNIAVFFAQNAMLRKTLFDKRANSCFCRLIAFCHRIIAAVLLVGGGNARAKAGERFCAGGIGKFEEEIPVGQHAKPHCLDIWSEFCGAMHRPESHPPSTHTNGGACVSIFSA